MNPEEFEKISQPIVTSVHCFPIQIDNRDNPIALEKGYPLIGFQVFFMTDNFNMNEFNPTHECTDRVFIFQDNIKNTHHHWLNSHEYALWLLNNI